MVIAVRDGCCEGYVERDYETMDSRAWGNGNVHTTPFLMYGMSAHPVCFVWPNLLAGWYMLKCSGIEQWSGLKKKF